jgi:DNA-binding IclR family transcriptional regulator
MGWVLLVLASWSGGAVLTTALACRCARCLQRHRPAPQVVDLIPTDLDWVEVVVHPSDTRLDPAATAALLRDLRRHGVAVDRRG